jgi:hypothetical protein
VNTRITPDITYEIQANVWLYPGMAGWHFVSIDKKTAEEIKDNHGYLRKGFGSIPVEVTIGETTWKTSLFPDKSGEYLLPLKADVRKKEGIKMGDTLTVSLRIKL